ncbi:MAG: hypothetical protein WCC70_01590 [Candidatus Aquilonibacter sp.]|jgi:hypothetical protein
MLSILLAAGLFSPTPAPSPTLPEIMHTVTSPMCSALQNVTIPVGYNSRVNDQAFLAMALTSRKFLSSFMPGDIPTAAEVEAAFEGVNSGTALYGNGSSAPTDIDVPGKGDDPTLYGPKQTILMANLDRIANEIVTNLSAERKYVSDSLQQYPPGADPHVDVLRAHAQNVIALQQALLDRYQRITGQYFGNRGVPGAAVNTQTDPATLNAAIRGLLLGEVASMGSTQANYAEFDSIQSLAEAGSAGQVVSALRDQELYFTKALFEAYNQCHGTHYTVEPRR